MDTSIIFFFSQMPSGTFLAVGSIFMMFGIFFSLIEGFEI